MVINFCGCAAFYNYIGLDFSTLFYNNKNLNTAILPPAQARLMVFCELESLSNKSNATITYPTEIDR